MYGGPYYSIVEDEDDEDDEDNGREDVGMQEIII